MNMGAWEFVRPRILTVRKVRVFCFCASSSVFPFFPSPNPKLHMRERANARASASATTCIVLTHTHAWVCLMYVWELVQALGLSTDVDSISYAGRAPSASTATGFPAAHKQEQEQVVADALE